ncbi:spore germination protein [Cohnella sp. OV330]|uniref:Ger(x)C family spore germination protein n=1 Tax=Cohnella sp. OV330 TaxID=1855288 RepID=UPI0008F2B457|nr:Ger(x)C family spore germination protein [Cohnella sp. OV330]SFB39039.1 spore germination protein [Cohnella sp. OV330]
MRRKGIGWLLALSLLSGCADQKILEKIGFARTIILEKAEGQDKALKVTISIPKTNQTESIVYTDVARSFKQAKIHFDMQNDRRIVLGQLRQVMFGASLARQGVWLPMESVFRDPAIGIRTHVIVAEGDIGRFVTRKYVQGGTMGEYIDNLLRSDPATRGQFDTNLHTFLRDYYDDGAEPVATIIGETVEGLKVKGIALFVRDRYVAKIQAEDAMFFSLLRSDAKNVSLFMDEVETPRGAGSISLANVIGKRKIKILSPPDPNRKKPARIVVELKLKGSLMEYDDLLEMNNLASQPVLERAMGKYVADRCERLIREMQKPGADGIGIGSHVRDRMRYKDWKALDWNQAFSDAEIEVVADIKIRDYGRLIDASA